MIVIFFWVMGFEIGSTRMDVDRWGLDGQWSWQCRWAPLCLHINGIGLTSFVIRITNSTSRLIFIDCNLDSILAFSSPPLIRGA